MTSAESQLRALHLDRWSGDAHNPHIVSSSTLLTPNQLRQYEIFEDCNDALLEAIRHDVSVALWEPNAVLFEEGTYIDIAFYVARGEVEVSLERVAGAQPQPIFDNERTLLADAPIDHDVGKTVVGRAPPAKAPQEITLLAALDVDLSPGETLVLGRGEFFGEIGALCGWPQSVTARTKHRCELVQIRLPALRRLRRHAPLRERLDAAYRERSLMTHLKTTPLFGMCDEALLDAVAREVELISLEPGNQLTVEGEPADALYMVRSGFLKLEQRMGATDAVVTYLSKGMTLGEVELLVGTEGWEASARSVEYSELVKLPEAALRRVLDQQPAAEKLLWRSAVNRIRESGFSRANIGRAEFTEFALDSGVVQGTSILVIDLETCTRCDDCVRACAATHDGRPRFVREGNKSSNLLIAKSCYHCRDPVCLVGCPTGAIRRTGIGDVVAINDDICIGCGKCSSQCPYDNIVMHDTGETWPEDTPLADPGEPRLVATKCDLCQSTNHEPACVSNCPQGCAVRVTSLDAFEALVKRTD